MNKDNVEFLRNHFEDMALRARMESRTAQYGLQLSELVKRQANTIEGLNKKLAEDKKED